MKHSLTLYLAFVFLIFGCSSDEGAESQVGYNVYFNIVVDSNNVFNNENYSIEMAGYRPANGSTTFPFTDDFRTFHFRDSLFVIQSANLGGPSLANPLILDFGNNDLDTIAIDRNPPLYDVYYNNQIVKTYDLTYGEFVIEFWDRNGNSFSNNPNPIIITVEKKLEAQQ